MSAEDPLQKLLAYLGELDKRRIYYHLLKSREDAIMVEIVVPGWRWEVEFFPHGEVEVEMFRSTVGVMGGKDAEEASRGSFEKMTRQSGHSDENSRGIRRSAERSASTALLSSKPIGLASLGGLVMGA